MDKDVDNGDDMQLSEHNEGNADSVNDNHNHDAKLWKAACCRCDKVIISHQDASSPGSSCTKISKQKSLRRKTNTTTAKSTRTVVAMVPPQFVFLHQGNTSTRATATTVVDNHGNKVLHVLPAMIDTKNVTAEYYGRILQFYLDRILARQSEEKMTVLLDVRPGVGWPNPSAIFMIPFIRKIVTMLQGHFPGRLEKLVVFPVPLAALGVFHAVQWVFHAELMEKIVLISGPAERKSPLPKSDLTKYISETNLDITETARLEKFLS
jgi:CRAL/TRIO domain